MKNRCEFGGKIVSNKLVLMKSRNTGRDMLTVNLEIQNFKPDGSPGGRAWVNVTFMDNNALELYDKAKQGDHISLVCMITSYQDQNKKWQNSFFGSEFSFIDVENSAAVEEAAAY